MNACSVFGERCSGPVLGKSMHMQDFIVVLKFPSPVGPFQPVNETNPDFIMGISNITLTNASNPAYEVNLAPCTRSGLRFEDNDKTIIFWITLDLHPNVKHNVTIPDAWLLLSLVKLFAHSYPSCVET